MKVSIAGPRGLVFSATEPDEELNRYYRAKIRDALASEFSQFIEECAVAMRQLAEGESKTIESKPVTVTLSRPIERPDPTP